MKAARSAAAVLALLTGCAAQAPPGTRHGGPCPILASSDWKAWVNAMPPGSPYLIVVGNVTVPTGGYRLSLERGPVLEIHPPIQHIILEVDPPRDGATQAVVTQEVRASFPALDSYGEVTVRCGGKTLANIRDVVRAY